MLRSTSDIRRLVLLCGVVSIATIGACADSPTDPRSHEARQTAPRVLHDEDPGAPPITNCDGGWTVVNGRWECAGI